MDILNTVPILNLLLLRVVPYFPKKDQRLNKKYRCSREKTGTQVSSLFEARRCLELEFLFRCTYFDEKGGSSQGRKEKHYLSVLVFWSDGFLLIIQCFHSFCQGVFAFFHPNFTTLMTKLNELCST